MPKPFQGVHPFHTETLCPLNSYHQTADSTQQFLNEVFNFSSRYSNFKIFECKIWQLLLYLHLYCLDHFWKGRRTLLVFKYFKQTASFVSLWTFKSCKIGFQLQFEKDVCSALDSTKVQISSKTFFSCSAGLVVDPLIVTYIIIIWYFKIIIYYHNLCQYKQWCAAISFFYQKMYLALQLKVNI